jgi:hypothetical protein
MPPDRSDVRHPPRAAGYDDIMRTFRRTGMLSRFSGLRTWASVLMLGAATGVGVKLAARGDSLVHRGGLAAGAAFVDSLQRRAAAAADSRAVGLADAVALGYLERLRLGLGSPFRLAEYALRDPRLDSTVRRHVAWAIVGRTLAGSGYVIDPAALRGIEPSAGTQLDVGLSAATRHLTLIDATLASGRDPRAGELAVRLAYSLAAAERTVDRGAVSLVAPVAALLRDRLSAMSDARRLLREARASSTDPLNLLATWRRDRRFAVERPASEAMAEAVEAEAMERVPALLDSIRAVVATPTDAEPGELTAVSAVSLPRDPAKAPLAAAAVERLAAAVARYGPPQTPVVTVVRQHAASLVAAPGDLRAGSARRAFVERAVNEETLAAEYARLAAHDAGDPTAARAAVAAAAALRAYAQETPWFPGDPAPGEDELRREFGIASVRFDPGVPATWRSYYRRMLADGLRDLGRVLPDLTLDGARVRFRNGSLGGATLAMHDPGSRTIHLPIATSAGAIAHEVAHDLDWQMGRGRYGRRGSYGTDVVVREQRGRLAASLRGLTSARLIPPAAANSSRPPDEVRPAEVFARTLDWFVSVALAREGRMNGYLTAVQDEVLTGHVAVLPRDVGGWSAQALADVLEETTLVGAPLREWFLAQWGPARVRRPYALTREILATPIGRRPDWGPAATPTLHLERYAAAAGESTQPRARLARLAAEARARGILRARAQRYPRSSTPPWADSLLGSGPWAPGLGEAAVRRLGALILTRLEESGAAGAALEWGDESR